MPFQNTVALQMGFGVPGEIYANAPRVSSSWTLNSASPNIFGYAFSVLSQGFAQVGNPGGTAVFAGILVNPKGSASYGAPGGAPLSPTLTLANFSQGELATEGSFVVTLPAAAAIGDVVIYDETTGALSTIAPGVSLPSGKLYANAYVWYYTVAAAGLAVIKMQEVIPAVVQ